MKEEIISWLEGDRDYAKGRAIFEKYSRKKSLINLFRRKYKPEVLRYNLEKLSKTMTGMKMITPIPASVKVDQKIKGERLIIMTDKVNYDDLPEGLRKLYDQNKELYKHMRAYHEKMKQAVTDGERAKLQKILAGYDDAIAGNWHQIDAWDGKEEKIEETNTDPEKDISAARKWLSVNVKYISLREGVKQQELIFSIKDRVALLKKHQVKIPKSTVTELAKFGVDI